MGNVIRNLSASPFTIDDWGTSITFPAGDTDITDRLSSRTINTSVQLQAEINAGNAQVIVDGQETSAGTYQAYVSVRQAGGTLQGLEDTDVPGHVEVRGDPGTSFTVYNVFDETDVANYKAVEFLNTDPVDVLLAFELPSDFSAFKAANTSPAGSAFLFHAKALNGVPSWFIKEVWDTSGVKQTIASTPQTSPTRTAVTLDRSLLTGTYEGGKTCFLVVTLTPDSISDIVCVDTQSSRAGVVQV